MAMQMDAHASSASSPRRASTSSSRRWLMCRVPSEWKEAKPTDFVPKVLRLGFESTPLADSHAERHQHELKLKIKEVFLAWKTETVADYDWDAHKRLLEIDAKEMRTIYELHRNSSRSTADDDYNDYDNDYVQDVLALDALVVLVMLMMCLASSSTNIEECTFQQTHVNTFLTQADRFVTQIFTPFKLRSSQIRIMRDLFLLEQQLPMSLLHKTMCTFFPINDASIHEASKSELKHILLWVLCRFCPFNEAGFSIFRFIGDKIQDNILEYRHLLDYLHQIMCTKEERLTPSVSSAPDFYKVSQIFSDSEQVPSASELEKVGITIKSREGDINKFEFKRAVLWLPRLCLYDYTISILLNLVAFEILAFENPIYLYPYLVLLGNLAQTENDMELLLKEDVILNCILNNNSEVKEMLNGLLKNMPVYVQETKKWKEILQYYKKDRQGTKKWKEILQYFKKEMKEILQYFKKEILQFFKKEILQCFERGAHALCNEFKNTCFSNL